MWANGVFVNRVLVQLCVGKGNTTVDETVMLDIHTYQHTGAVHAACHPPSPPL